MQAREPVLVRTKFFTGPAVPQLFDHCHIPDNVAEHRRPFSLVVNSGNEPFLLLPTAQRSHADVQLLGGFSSAAPSRFRIHG